ncbi:MAG: hypothetical protein A3E82_01965 [Gammaproteobacteria bacterium RIFCSPHIGHO2_12_FULL_38_11]|nr:MAG: hypothetical protein A3E82_01965 [Gammaproteobacteria bacterium RIFCSPHIGHO2_12_FULL_38_11]
MMILKLKSFHRWAKSEGVSDASLKKAVNEITRGLVEGDLGGGLFKKRVAREGEGKRGGFRTMLAFRRDDRSIFILGYPKSATDNIGDDELLTLKKLAKELLNATDAEIRKRILVGELIEVK